jgi:tRNA threonylcarbamoyladenosine biosynthesis protein TsaE
VVNKIQKELIVNSLAELDKIAQELIDFIGESKVILFEGEMGSGKTTFIKQFCKKINVLDEVASPTYSIINEYKTKSNEPVYHIDLYRLKNEEEIIHIGLEDYIKNDYYCLVEWPTKADFIFTGKEVKVSIEVLKDNSRKFIFIK